MKILYCGNKSQDEASLKSFFEKKDVVDTFRSWFDIKKVLQKEGGYDLFFLQNKIPIFDGFTIGQILNKVYSYSAKKIILLKDKNELLEFKYNKFQVLESPLKKDELQAVYQKAFHSKSKVKLICERNKNQGQLVS